MYPIYYRNEKYQFNSYLEKNAKKDLYKVKKFYKVKKLTLYCK